MFFGKKAADKADLLPSPYVQLWCSFRSVSAPAVVKILPRRTSRRDVDRLLAEWAGKVNKLLAHIEAKYVDVSGGSVPSATRGVRRV